MGFTPPPPSKPPNRGFGGNSEPKMYSYRAILYFEGHVKPPTNCPNTEQLPPVFGELVVDYLGGTISSE